MKIKGDGYAPPKGPLEKLATSLDDKAFCYAALGKVSRSFSAVIQQLPEDLKDTIGVFYLVLRALDTIEDDMNFPLEKKLPLLVDFHKISNNEKFSLSGVGDNRDYEVLLENYPKVYRTFTLLSKDAQEIITDISKRMGEGMAEFAQKEILTVDDFDLYCHYVAGLVGIGLTRLFLSSNPDALDLKVKNGISNAMGLFLQKTNIIRDYHEDLYSDRTFWPKEIWGKHVKSLEYLAKNNKDPESLACLNHIIANALGHVPDCLTYMSSVKDEKIFDFIAVPQVMAMATLAKLYNNPKVLTGIVKVRKGLAAKLMMYSINLKDVYKYFKKSIRQIEKKNKPGTPYSKETAEVLKHIRHFLDKNTF